MRRKYDEWKAEHANEPPFHNYPPDSEYSDDYPPTPTSFDSYKAGLRRERAAILREQAKVERQDTSTPRNAENPTFRFTRSATTSSTVFLELDEDGRAARLQKWAKKGQARYALTATAVLG